MLHIIFKVYPNSLVVIPTDDSSDTFEMWTRQFVGARDVGSTALLVNRYNSSGKFESDAPLYWDKTWNLMGRPMTVATVTYLPYSMTLNMVSDWTDCLSTIPQYVFWLKTASTGNVNELNSTEEKTIFYDGTEARLVLEFCRLRNCTLEILPCMYTECDFYIINRLNDDSFAITSWLW